MISPLLPLLAFVAGIISFTSPCVLPLIPSYLSYVSGFPVAQLQSQTRSAVLRPSLAFVTGFTVVFTALGASSALVGSLLLRQLPIILDVAGVLLIAVGLASVGLLRMPFPVKERRLDLSRLPRGPKGAFVVGMAFAFGWTPCIGPVLATILGLAGASSTVAWGAALLALYSLGLGLPFITLAVWFSRARSSLTWLRRRGRSIEIVGGILLCVVGVLFVTGIWTQLFVPLQSRFAQLGWPPL